MNQERLEKIKRAFEGVGPQKGELYTNQEIVDLLMALQKTMLTGVYEKTHAEHMREKDLLRHFTSLAEEYGLEETRVFRQFKKNMKDLGYTVASFINGIKGERMTKRNLKALSYDKNVKILYNIALEDEEARTEYDAIVIAPYGLFVVETKNWSVDMQIDENGILRNLSGTISYDLPGRMSVKEGLLHECLGDYFPKQYQNVVLFLNEYSSVQDGYHKLPICYGGGITYRIREFNTGEEVLSAEQIEAIAEQLQKCHVEQKTECKVNCEAIVEDYATLMCAMEEAAEGDYELVESLYEPEEELPDTSVPMEKSKVQQTDQGQFDSKISKTVYLTIASSVVAVIAGILLGRHHKN